MKIKILILGTFLCCYSCQKNGAQIAAAKKQLAAKYTAAELAQLEYGCVEILDKEAYRLLSDKARNDSHDLSDAGQYEQALKQAENAGKYSDSAGQGTDKIFYKVSYYRATAKDTLAQGIMFLNDENKKIGFTQQK